MKYTISDHALVRYIERIHGVDVRSLKRQISKGLTERMPNPPDGEFSLKMGNGLKFVIVDRVVKTVIPK